MTYPGRRSLVAVLFGVVALGVFAVAPASAQGCPVPPNSLKAMFTSIQIQASSNPQSWVATIGLRVDCISPSGQDIGDVNATVEMWVQGVTASLNGAPQGQHVIVQAPGTFTISYPAGSSFSQIQWFMQIPGAGVQAFSGWVNSGNSPLQVGPISANTPELGSLILFGTGAAGGAAYLFARVRGGRRQPTKPND